MRLVPPDVIGPIEHPHTQSDRHKVPIYIQFPQHMPTADTSWIVDTSMTPMKPLAVETDVFLPLFGEGCIVAVVDLTEFSGNIIVSPDAHPADCIYLAVPRTRIEMPSPPTVNHRGPTMAIPEGPHGVWSRKLKRAISTQFDKLRNLRLPSHVERPEEMPNSDKQ
ncbi:hypothetical protein OH77DRAFT_1432420 [Trametes cingulata]|nr:hypothetical protein OH77DRAFT_1432420 [Trametes cingulata]